MSDEQVLSGGSTHNGQVVRVGDEIHRPRTQGAELVESFLLHLELVGFDASPRFLGIDESGRQVLTFVEGEVTIEPPWLHDDDANRSHLVAVARLLRRLHDAATGFVAPPGSAPRRICPTPGTTWLHGDVHYGNLVFREDDAVALVDWDFVMPGDPLYDVVALLFSARCPRPDRPDEFDDRSTSAHHTLEAVLEGYGADSTQRRRATAVAAAFCDGAAEFLVDLGTERSGATTVPELQREVDRRRFLAAWWRQQAAQEHRKP